jgi:hypothetical protein
MIDALTVTLGMVPKLDEARRVLLCFVDATPCRSIHSRGVTR